MGFFNGFSNALKKIGNTEYTLDNVVIDTVRFSDSIFNTLLFKNSNDIFNEHSRIIHQCTIERNNGNEDEADRYYLVARDYILNHVKRIYYEEDLQYSEIQTIVSFSLSNLSDIIGIVQNIDGQRSQQYFSGFTLQEQTVESLTQNVCQIISREYTMYLRDYLANLENYQHYAEYINNSQAPGAGGSFLTGAMGGAAALVNPLLGLGIIAKGLYDNYQNSQNEQAKIDKFRSIEKKWSDSFFNLKKIQLDICEEICKFIAGKLFSAFEEFIGAIEQYCTEYNYDVSNICNEIYQYRINYGEIPTFDNENTKEIFIKLFNTVIANEDLHPDVLKFYKKVLQRLS